MLAGWLLHHPLLLQGGWVLWQRHTEPLMLAALHCNRQ
jgi:hypothetical protein